MIKMSFISATVTPKTGNLLYIVAISLLMLGSWTTLQTHDIKKAKWLIGTWENKTPKGSIYETWSKSSGSTFSGKSYIIKEKDTIVFENIRLVQEKGGLFYIPTVKDQNNDLPVRFRAKTVSARQLIFENPEHDFPQTITYTKINKDSIVAEISGTKNGQLRKQAYPMRRVK